MKQIKKAKAVLSLALALVFAFTLFPGLVAGAVDSVVKVLVEPTLVFDWVYPFYDGMALVRLNDKWGFTDTTGEFVIPADYEMAGSFSEGRAPVKKDGKYGFIDKTGEVIVDFGYDQVNLSNGIAFFDGLAAVSKDGKWGYVDPDGDEVIPFVYDLAETFCDGLARVWNHGFNGFIDTAGEPVLLWEDWEDDIHAVFGYFSEGLAAVGHGVWSDEANDWRDYKLGFADKTGQIVIPCEYDEVWDFSDGMAAVCKDGKYGFVDKTGEIKGSLVYNWVNPFCNGFATVFKDGLCRFMDKTGTEIGLFIWVGPFYGGLAPAWQLGGGWVVVESGEGAVVTTLAYDDVYCSDWQSDPGLFWVRKDGKYGIIQIAVTYTVNATAEAGGSVTGGGAYAVGDTVKLIAAANTNYAFDGWYENGVKIPDKGATYEFKAEADRTLAAKFTYIGGGSTGDISSPPTTTKPEPTPEPKTRYDDVSATDWFYDAVEYVSEEGLMTGTGPRIFSPDVPMTRAMLVTVLHRLEGKPAVEGENPFPDVKDGAWYADAVFWGNQNKIVLGYGDGTFKPDNPVTREEAVVTLHRYAAFKELDVGASDDLEGFTDAGKVSGWALAAMQWAVAEKIIEGRTPTTIVPQGSAARAQITAMIMRCIEDFLKD